MEHQNEMQTQEAITQEREDEESPISTKNSSLSSTSEWASKPGEQTFEEFVRSTIRDADRAEKLLDRCAFAASRSSIDRDREILRNRQTLAERKRLARVKMMISESGLRYTKADFELNDWGEKFTITDGNRRAYDACRAFAEFKAGDPGLTLWGPTTGIGKTYLLCAAAIKIIESGHSVKFVTFSDLLSKIRRSYEVKYDGNEPGNHTTKAVIESLLLPDVLILDDLGVEKLGTGEQGDWAREQFMTIVEGRIQAQKTICTTTNLTGLQLVERYGQRVVSRLMDRKHMVSVKVHGTDYRMHELVA